jgi:TolB-like protein
MRRAVAIATLVWVVALPARAADREPVAVMPFKNLNADAKLDWLRVGIAETMISDLRRSGVAIVERDQLDRALAEIALQDEGGAEASTAARVGKLVGARTVVVGGYQRAGKQVRITARFVTVETGVVRDTAKATGPLKRIFRLQDEITTKLIGRKPAPRRRARAASSTKKAGSKATPKGDKAAPSAADETVIDAYRLYSLSLVTSSQAERVQFLKKAIKLDPGFHYARADLEKLQRMLRKAEKAGRELGKKRAAKLLASLDEEGLAADQRTVRAMQVLGALQAEVRYRDLAAVAKRIYEMGLPVYFGQNPREMSLYYLFVAHQQLKEYDLMLQAGERFMEEFPAGVYARQVQMGMEHLIQQRREAPERRAEYLEEIAEAEADRAKVLANERMKDDLKRQRMMQLDFRRCGAANLNRQYERSLEECTRFIEDWAEEEVARDLIHPARHGLIMAHYELGNFDEARLLADGWLDRDPKSAMKFGVNHLVRMFPRD